MLIKSKLLIFHQMLSKYLCRLKPMMSTSQLQKLQQLYNDKKYAEILQINNIADPTYMEVKNNYYRLIKKYHSDNCPNDESKAKLYEEISKIIIKSYHDLDKEKFSKERASRGQDYSYAEEDEICMELFNKKFSQVKYWMYEEGNEKAKEQFFKKLFEKTGKPSRSSSYNQRATAYTSSSYSTSQNFNRQTRGSQQKDGGLGSQFMLAATGAAALVGLFILGYFNYNSKKAPQPRQIVQQPKVKYDQKVIQQVMGMKMEKARIKSDKMIESIVKDHPPCLHIPFDEEPHLMKQLIQYSIAPDIHLYEVDPKYYQGNLKEEVIKNGIDKKNAFELTRIKPNTVMTLSLQAERSLQNTYVRVRDVINEIKKTGTFKPPQIFFRFHGFIMMELREKPITLTNYRDTDYISLFDLYFDYYSPIWLKKDCFTEYLVGKDQPKYFGYVHLNNRRCDSVYMNTGDKAAFFLPRYNREKAMSDALWTNYYSTYASKWAANTD